MAGLRKRASQDSAPEPSRVQQEPESVENEPAQNGSAENEPAQNEPAENAAASSDVAAPKSPAEPETPEESTTTDAEAEAETSVVVDQGVVGVEAPKAGTADTEDAEAPAAEPPAGEPEPTPPTPAESRAEAVDEQRATQHWFGDQRTLIGAMVVLTVLFGVLAFWFRTEANALTEEGPAANEVLVDNAATSELNGQISDAVEKVFSYDFADTGKTERAAADLLVGDAVGEYNQLFTTVKQQAPLQKLVVTTTVKASGVTRLQGDRAEVLIFVDQNAVRTDSGQSNVGPAQITVGAEKHGDQWKINSITQR